MKSKSKRFLLAPLAAMLLFFGMANEGCEDDGPPTTLEQACADHGGVRAGSLEKDNDGGGEARCNDNVEAEQDAPGQDWYVDEE